MKNKRILITIPSDVKNDLIRFTKLQDIDIAVAVQMAIAESAGESPEKTDMEAKAENNEGLWVSMSDTTCRLLELWSEKTGLTKSKLITYAVKNMIESEEKEEF